MKRDATAYHEAGHAVMAVLLPGFVVEYATIKGGVDYQGLVKSKQRGRLNPDVGTPQMREKIERQIMVTLAGDIAQREFAPRSSRNWQTTSDREVVVHLASQYSGSAESTTAYIAWLHIRTRDIIRGRWALVDRVAKALIEHETLSGEEIRSLIVGRRYPIRYPSGEQ